MTELEWLTARQAGKLLRFIEPRTSDRKLHYYYIACARRLESILPGPMSLVGVNVLESFVEGKCSETDLRDISWHVEGAAFAAEDGYGIPWLDMMDQIPESYLTELAANPEERVTNGRQLVVSAAYFVDSVVCTVPRVRRSRDIPSSRFCPVSLIHEVFGNPFRTVKFRRHWRTQSVLDLANSMYTSRNFSAMPILADALEEAGCDDSDVLNHCRGPETHVRGCWVVDRLLCKK